MGMSSGAGFNDGSPGILSSTMAGLSGGRALGTAASSSSVSTGGGGFSRVLAVSRDPTAAAGRSVEIPPPGKLSISTRDWPWSGFNIDRSGFGKSMIGAGVSPGRSSIPASSTAGDGAPDKLLRTLL